MGSLLNIGDLTDLYAKYGIVNFIETGIGKGTSIKYALKHSFFKQLISIDIDQKAIDAVKITDPRCQLLCGSSPIVLETILPQLKGPTLFWLDAHLIPTKDKEGHYDEETILGPLVGELTVITMDRKARMSDVFMIDDLRRFEYVPSGRVPWTPDFNNPRSGFIHAALGPTHDIQRISNSEGGILLATPRFKHLP